MDTFQLSLLNIFLYKNLSSIQSQQYFQLLEKDYQQQIMLQNSQIFNNNLIQNLKPTIIPHTFNNNYNIISTNISQNLISNQEILLNKKRICSEEIMISQKIENNLEIISKNQLCDQKFLLIENKLSHEMNCEQNKSKIFECKHKGCNLSFKTKRQQIVHHNKFERECLNDKNILIKLIGKYKQALNSILTKYNVKIENFENSKIFGNLSRKFNDTLNFLQDREFFDSFVGGRF